jgi:DNA primase
VAYISEESILEVKRASDIYEVVSNYVAMRPSGSNYKGLCPFHQEKTPSFLVSVPKQIYKCFGCGKGGGVIDFVKEMEKVDFGDAIKILADHAGIQLKYVGTDTKKEYGRDTIYKTNRWAADQYNQLLKGLPEDSPARQLLKARKINAETVDLYMLGAAPESWDWLIRQAKKFGIDDQQLLDAGLITKGDKGFYDRFRNRFMIPIIDPANRVIGFGARALAKGQEPKYLNSPDTPVFTKGKTFFGLNLVKNTDVLYVVEGYFDVIVPYQYGVKGLVATLGTALTKDHISILRRYTSKVGLLFDPDEAGQAASRRGIDMLLGEDIDIRVCRLTQDPDDMVISGGPDALQKALNEPLDLFNFMVEGLSKEYDPRSVAGKDGLVDALLERVRMIEKESKREILIGMISTRFGVSVKTLTDRLGTLRVRETVTSTPAAKKVALNSDSKLAREVIAVVCQDNQRVHTLRQIGKENIPSDAARKIVQKIFELAEQNQAFDASDLLAFFPNTDESREILLDVAQNIENAENAEPEKRLEQVLKALELQKIKRRAEELNSALKKQWNEKEFTELSQIMAKLKKAEK